MLEAYVDDSGNSEGGKIFVLAGYVLPAGRWIDFSKQWGSVLRRAPAISCFKMAHAESGDGYLLGIDREFRLLKANELSAVIPPYAPMALSCHVNWKDWEEIVGDRVPKPLRNPYAVLFFNIMTLMHSWQKRLGMCRKVDFIFDEQGVAGLPGTPLKVSDSRLS